MLFFSHFPTKTSSLGLLIAAALALASCVNTTAPTRRGASAFLPPVEARSIPTVSLVGTHWEVEYPDDAFQHAEFDFQTNGRAHIKQDDGDSRLGWNHYSGTWAQDGDRVIVFLRGRTIYDGRISSGVMQGVVRNTVNSRTAPFIARTGSALAQFDRQTDAEFSRVWRGIVEDSGRTMNRILAAGSQVSYEDCVCLYDELKGENRVAGNNTIKIRSSKGTWTLTYYFDLHDCLIKGAGNLEGRTINVRFEGGTPASLQTAFGKGHCKVSSATRS